MPAVTDEELEQQIAAAVAAEDPAALLALAGAHALTLDQLERVGESLVDLNYELGVDDDDPGPLLVRAAMLRDGPAVPWTFTRGRSTYDFGAANPWTLQDAIAFGEAWDEGLELTSPVAARVPWPNALASQLALDYAARLLRDLCGACDDAARNLLLARLADLRVAHEKSDRRRLGEIGLELGKLAARAEKVAPRCADAAEAAVTDPVLNERAYAWEGARIAALAVLTCTSAPHEALGELFELRRLAIYPIHAAEHNRDRWYARYMADYDFLLHGDELVPDAQDIIHQILHAALDAYALPPAT